MGINEVVYRSSFIVSIPENLLQKTSKEIFDYTTFFYKYKDEKDELENYTETGAPYGGAEGNHYRKEPANRVYPNRDPRGGMFETK